LQWDTSERIPQISRLAWIGDLSVKRNPFQFFSIRRLERLNRKLRVELQCQRSRIFTNDGDIVRQLCERRAGCDQQYDKECAHKSKKAERESLSHSAEITLADSANLIKACLDNTIAGRINLAVATNL
jgi:uncharacterized glyoxalase superfamily metalloenzyme YdcJ